MRIRIQLLFLCGSRYSFIKIVKKLPYEEFSVAEKNYNIAQV